tara:strand:- start:270 stop:389 length:120 start_codon:yes stop_codon:yes gene_type:complete
VCGGAVRYLRFYNIKCLLDGKASARVTQPNFGATPRFFG